LLVCGFLWLPLRAWLWGRLVGAQGLDRGEMFRRVLDVSLAPSAEERRRRGHALLQALFDPLRIEVDPPDTSAGDPHVTDDGLVLHLPASGDAPALALHYAGAGRRLFNARDAAIAREMRVMLSHADRSRDAYRQGMLDERGRIARDLHDDVGARLLSSLHQQDLPRTREVVQGAVAEMRTIIDGLGGRHMALGELVAELRHETALRLEVAGIALDWPLPEADAGEALDYRAWRNGISMLRELVSNVLRHARAGAVRIRLRCEAGALVGEVADDGVGMGATDGGGHGLDNLRRRVKELGGAVAFEPGAGGGTRVRFLIPLVDAPSARPAAARLFESGRA
jgi:signal transduction histidine kinase